MFEQAHNKMLDVDSCDNNGDLAEQDNICRDYLRNVCHRGKRCKYLHPGPKEANEMGRGINYVFCHDFQNKECHRPKCKFIHCSKSEERYYYATGKLPQCLLDTMETTCQGGNGAYNSNMDCSDIPVCLDYLKGACHRWGRCKYRHVSPADYDMEMRLGRRNEPYGIFNATFGDSESYEPEPKRRIFDDFGNNVPLVRQAVQQMAPMPADYYILEEENAFMRHKVEELKKQVADLSAANEFLLDQNAQNKQNVVASVAQALNPNSLAAASSAVPPSIAQISQQLPLNSDLTAAAQSLQPTCMPQELAAAANPQSMTPVVPVSLSASAMTPVSISSVSLTPAIPAASLAQSLPQNPLVSYPIMTQSMRPAIPQNSLTH